MDNQPLYEYDKVRSIILKNTFNTPVLGAVLQHKVVDELRAHFLKDALDKNKILEFLTQAVVNLTELQNRKSDKRDIAHVGCALMTAEQLRDYVCEGKFDFKEDNHDID